MSNPTKILVIQTAFLGDAVLATSLLEEITKRYENAELHLVVRSGVESLFVHHPNLKKVWVWQKKKNKFKNLYFLIKEIRLQKFDIVFNIQRFFSSGLMTFFSRAKITVGFDRNPLSVFFTKRVKHAVPYVSGQSFYHEVQRNFLLLKSLHPGVLVPTAKDLKPKLYFGHLGLDNANKPKAAYVVIAPASVWFTKQWSKEKWIELILALPKDCSIFLVGSQEDFIFCQEILERANRALVVNTCGKLNLLQTALLMKSAGRIFCNDSAPQHLASAVNAPTTTIFCSTVTDFGFGPLADDSKVVQVENLSCRPCGIHGRTACPLTHFHCSQHVDVEIVANTYVP